jgi:hypothetical protein
VHSLKLFTVFAVLLLLLFYASPAHAQQLAANSVVQSVSSPDFQPGQGGTITVKVGNPFNSSMADITLTLSIYAFVQGAAYTATSSIPATHRPYFVGSGITTETLYFSSLPAAKTRNLSYAVQTNYTTPHGSFFSEGTYMVSMSILFLIGQTPYRMASKGYFSTAQWQKILVQNGSYSSLNYTYLNRTLGFAGILPDTSFGVNSAAPWSLFFASGILAAALAAAGAISFRKTHRRR